MTSCGYVLFELELSTCVPDFVSNLHDFSIIKKKNVAICILAHKFFKEKFLIFSEFGHSAYQILQASASKILENFGIFRFLRFLRDHNFFRKKYFLLKYFLFFRHHQVESFKALSRGKTLPDEKDTAYFVRTIFGFFTFGDSIHPRVYRVQIDDSCLSFCQNRGLLSL